ncbi:MAG: regulatory protein TetR [Frankiales bacterium]|nr:regulatory protein TetR [Frankiales bacterium]
MTATPARVEATDALLDAAEAMLVDVGYAAITTRRLAERAGVNHGLVHYYFGSMEDLLLRVVERFTDQLIERQQTMYAADVPFIDKWRQAMRYLDEDAESGYQKVWFEMQAMAWNNEAIRDRVQKVSQRWIDVVSPAFDRGLVELGVDRRRFPTKAVVSLVVTFNQGVMLEKLTGFDSGHRDLLRMVDRTFEGLWEAQQHASSRA